MHQKRLCLALSAAPIGNTVLHLDKALGRIRDYEHVKPKSEFNPRSASNAGVGNVSSAALPSADRTEGTITHEAARRHLTCCLGFMFIHCVCEQKVRRLMCAALRSIPSSWTVKSKPSLGRSFPSLR